MFTKKEAHTVFKKCWEMMNATRKGDAHDDSIWQECINKSHQIYNEYPSEFCKDIVTAVSYEAEREAKLDQKSRSAEYRTAATAYQAAWKMLECFLDDLEGFKSEGEQTLKAYKERFQGRFAETMGQVVYDAADAEAKNKGTFMQDAYTFYEEFKDGISPEQEPDAYAKAENIIDVHPEYMLQMMDMYADLKKRSALNAA